MRNYGGGTAPVDRLGFLSVDQRHHAVMSITLSVRPAAMAGITLSVLWMRIQLYHTKYNASAWQW
jgi:hypothetical protein